MQVLRLILLSIFLPLVLGTAQAAREQQKVLLIERSDRMMTVKLYYHKGQAKIEAFGGKEATPAMVTFLDFKKADDVMFDLKGKTQILTIQKLRMRLKELKEGDRDAYNEMLMKQKADETRRKNLKLKSSPSSVNKETADACTWYSIDPEPQEGMITDVCISNYEKPIVRACLALLKEIESLHKKTYPLTYRGLPVVTSTSPGYRKDGFIEPGYLIKKAYSQTILKTSGKKRLLKPQVSNFEYSFIHGDPKTLFAIPEAWKTFKKASI